MRPPGRHRRTVAVGPKRATTGSRIPVALSQVVEPLDIASLDRVKVAEEWAIARRRLGRCGARRPRLDKARNAVIVSLTARGPRITNLSIVRPLTLMFVLRSDELCCLGRCSPLSFRPRGDVLMARMHVRRQGMSIVDVDVKSWPPKVPRNVGDIVHVSVDDTMLIPNGAITLRAMCKAISHPVPVRTKVAAVITPGHGSDEVKIILEMIATIMVWHKIFVGMDPS